jgi:hypothetical protein
MKIAIIALLLSALSIQTSLAQNPTYILEVNDLTVTLNTLEFDIDMTWTNPGVVSNFEYSNGQYFFDANLDEISNGGIISYMFAGYPDTLSDLPVHQRPRNPTVSGNQLRLALGIFPGPGNGFQFPTNETVRIIRMKVLTTSNCFSFGSYFNLVWRNGPTNPYTKILTHVGNVGTDITTPSAHFINIPNYPFPYSRPVLCSPANNSEVASNNVLFSWRRVQNAANFKLYVSKDSNFTNIVYSDTSITDTSRSIFIREASRNHYWKIISKDSASGVNDTSVVWSFRVGGNVTLSYPSSNDSIFVTEKLRWLKLSNAAKYRLVIANDSLLTNKVFEDSTITDTAIAASNLLAERQYFWAVHAVDSGNILTGTSRTGKFRTIYTLSLLVKCAVQGMLIPVPGSMSRKDTFTVFLRQSIPPYAIVDSAKAEVDTVTLIGHFRFAIAQTGTYYIVARHFNSLETWSRANGQYLQYGVQNLYDFTASASQAYGDNMKLKAGKWCFYSGDINQDRYIDGSDLIRISSSSFIFEVGPRLKEDLDGNGVVDGTDYLIGDNNRFFIGTISPLNSYRSQESLLEEVKGN